MIVWPPPFFFLILKLNSCSISMFQYLIGMLLSSLDVMHLPDCCLFVVRHLHWLLLPYWRYLALHCNVKELAVCFRNQILLLLRCWSPTMSHLQYRLLFRVFQGYPSCWWNLKEICHMKFLCCMWIVLLLKGGQAVMQARMSISSLSSSLMSSKSFSSVMFKPICSQRLLDGIS